MFKGKLSDKIEGKVIGKQERDSIFFAPTYMGCTASGLSDLNEAVPTKETVYTGDFDGEIKKFTTNPHTELKKGMTITILEYKRRFFGDYHELLMGGSRVEFVA